MNNERVKPLTSELAQQLSDYLYCDKDWNMPNPEVFDGVDAIAEHRHTVIDTATHEGVQKGELQRLRADARRGLDSSEENPNRHGCIKPDTDTQVFFYEQDFYVLSNFSAFTLTWKGIRFDTSEAAYHWEKFCVDSSIHPMWLKAIQTEIIHAPSAHEAYKLAEKRKTYRRKDWDDVKVGIMRDILRAKAQQHEYVRRKLLDTGNRELIEDSWRDDFWGWGPNRDGKNMLGRLWMEVRRELTTAIDAAQQEQDHE